MLLLSKLQNLLGFTITTKRIYDSINNIEPFSHFLPNTKKNVSHSNYDISVFIRTTNITNSKTKYPIKLSRNGSLWIWSLDLSVRTICCISLFASILAFSYSIDALPKDLASSGIFFTPKKITAITTTIIIYIK
jgi:hypothetical protein